MEIKKVKKMLFVHDHKIGLFNNEYYSNGNFPPSVIKRYSNFTQNLCFVCREYNIDAEEASKMTKTYIENGRFYFYSSHRTIIPIVRNYYYRDINSLISSSDIIVVRLPSLLGEEVLRRFYSLDKKPKLVIEVVGVLEESLKYHGTLLGKILANYKDKQMRKMIYQANNVIYITEKYLQEKYPTRGKKYIVPNVYIPDCYYSNPLDKKKKNNNSIIKIGILGTLDVKYKGHHVLQNSLNKLSTNRKIQVEMVGNSSNVKVQEFKAKNTNNRITYEYLGSLPHKDVFAWLKDLDILIQPSLTEGQGRVIIEAMSQGTIVLGSNVGGIVELLPENCLFKSNNSDDLVDKISQMIKYIDNNDELLMDIRLINYKKSMNFSESNVTNERIKVMNHIIEGDV